MTKIIEINNLSFSYDKKIFEDFNLSISKNSFTTILGSNSCGKTTLAKILVLEEKFDGEIIIDNTVLNNKTKEQIRNKIEIINENVDDNFICDTVKEDIMFSFEKFNLSNRKIEEKINNICDLLNIKHLLDKKIDTLSMGERQKVALASVLVIEPMILILDNALNVLSDEERINIYKILKKMDITVICFTNNVEDILISDKVVLINDYKVILNTTLKKALTKEKEFLSCNLELPFMVDLCNKLSYYDLLDDIVLDKKELVDLLWK